MLFCAVSPAQTSPPEDPLVAISRLLEASQKQVDQLTRENASLKAENARLRALLAPKSVSTDFDVATAQKARLLQARAIEEQTIVDQLKAEISAFQDKIDHPWKRDVIDVRNAQAQTAAYAKSIQDRQEKIAAHQTQIDEIKRELAALAP